MKISVLGAGAWGTALATVLTHNGHDVLIWAHEESVADDINRLHENRRYMPGIPLSKNIRASTDIEQVIADAQVIFEVIPVAYMRNVLAQVAHCFSKQQIWVIASKGIEQQTLMVPTEIINDIAQTKVIQAVVAGPSFAQDVAREQLTGVVVAARHKDIATQVQHLLDNAYFRTCITFDIQGVQIGSALKNVIALGVGMLDGAGMTDSTKALLLARGLQEMVTIGLERGAVQQTFFGLSGVGDLVLTAMGKLSRNLDAGRKIAQGYALSDIEKQLGCIPEGLNTVKSVYQLSQEQLHLPICECLYEIIYEGKNVKALLEVLAC